MITFPCAKINLGLNIVAKREDGFHDLETVFYPVPLTDALEVKLMATNNRTLCVRLITYWLAIFQFRAFMHIFISAYPPKQDLEVDLVMLRL